MGHAKCLLAIENENDMLNTLKIILEKELSVRDTEQLVANKKPTKSAKAGKNKVFVFYAINKPRPRSTFVRRRVTPNKASSFILAQFVHSAHFF